MADFKLPSGYDNFVTSTEDLLKEFKSNRGVQCDFVQYCIHLNDTGNHGSAGCLNRSYGLTLTEILRVRDGVNEYLQSTFSYYMWHKDPFSLSVVPYSISNNGSQAPRYYLQGFTRIGESIDDEWFAVLMLLKLSHLPLLAGASASIVDNDGQFVLIEASDYIPDWLCPENADNRVWIRDGKVCILDVEDVPGNSANYVSIDSALQYIHSTAASGMKDADFMTIDERIQVAIAKRTTGAYPAKSLALDHRVVCITPWWVNQLLSDSPQLVSLAVNCFFAFDARDRVSCKEYFPVDAAKHYTSMKEEVGRVSATTFNGDARDALVSTVRFTRPLYAQLTFKKFHPPRKYHALMRLVSQQGSRSANKAFDIGCRLAVGLEAAYHQSLYYSKLLETHSSHAGVEKLVAAAMRSGISQKQDSSISDSNSNNIDSCSGARITEENVRNFISSRILCLPRNVSGSGSGDTGSNEEEYAAMENFNRPAGSAYFHCLLSSMCARMAADRPAARTLDSEGNFVVDCADIINKTVASDDEGWLYMSPEEMDAEMNARMQRFATTSSSPTTTTSSSGKSGNSSKSSSSDKSCSPNSTTCPSVDVRASATVTPARVVSLSESATDANFSNGMTTVCGVGSSIFPVTATKTPVVSGSEATAIDSDDEEEGVGEVTSAVAAVEIDSDDEPQGTIDAPVDRDISNGIGDNPGARGDLFQDPAQLQNIVDGIKTFLQGTSDYDGVQTRGTANRKHKTAAVRTKSGMRDPSNGGGLAIDTDQLQKLLKQATTTADEAKGSAPLDRPEDDLAGYFDSADLQPLSSDENSDSGDSGRGSRDGDDSFDWSSDVEAEEEAQYRDDIQSSNKPEDEFMRDYMVRCASLGAVRLNIFITVWNVALCVHVL